jgi:hypothetical protein
MISLSDKFVLQEAFISTKKDLIDYFKDPKVKEFVKLSKKMVKEGGFENLTPQEQKAYRGLFEDPSISAYIQAARKAGERDGWLYGGGLGGAVGGVMGMALGGLATGTAFGTICIALLGAAASGVIIGWPMSKLVSILRKWKAEDDVVKLGAVGGKIGQTMPIVKV